MSNYIIDIDGTICTINDSYEMTEPLMDRIEKINKLYDQGNKIIYWTARGTVTGIDWSEVTKNQFEKWGVKYHELRFNKPDYDYWIDDKCIKSSEIINLLT